MSTLINGKSYTTSTNPEADEAARATQANWREAHKDDAPVVAVFDEHGAQTNYKGRTEVVVHDAPTFVVTQLSDGTTRKDNRTPLPVVPPPVTKDSTYRYTTADLARMADTKAFVRVGGDGAVQEASGNPNWLAPSQR